MTKSQRTGSEGTAGPGSKGPPHRRLSPTASFGIGIAPGTAPGHVVPALTWNRRDPDASGPHSVPPESGPGFVSVPPQGRLNLPGLIDRVLGAAEARSEAELLQAILGAVHEYLGADLAVIWLRAGEDGRPLLAARRVAADGNLEDVALPAGVDVREPEPVVAAIGHLAPRDQVQGFPLTAPDGALGRVWVGFAPGAFIPGEEATARVAQLIAHTLASRRLRRRVDELEARSRASVPSPVAAPAGLADLIELVPDAVLVTEPGSGRILLANSAAKARYDDGGGDLPGRTLRDIAFFETTVEGHRPSSRRPGSAGSPIRIRRATLQYLGQPAEMLLVHDRSRLFALQATVYNLHGDALLGRVMADAIHDIGGAHASIAADLASFQLELACAWTDTGRCGHVKNCMDLLSHARTAETRVRELSSGMAWWGRPEGSAARPVDLSAVAAAMLQLLAAQISRRAQVVRDLPAVPGVRANAALLGRVVLNVLLNALHALPDGATDSVLRVETRLVDGEVVLTVQDNGCGIATEHLDRVFEPFYTTKPAGIGSGLGLTISRDLVASWGGRIEVESRPGRGSTFRIALPAV